MPGFIGFFARRGELAEREGFETPDSPTSASLMLLALAGCLAFGSGRLSALISDVSACINETSLVAKH
jgi:hypothetical protein